MRLVAAWLCVLAVGYCVQGQATGERLLKTPPTATAARLSLRCQV